MAASVSPKPLVVGEAPGTAGDGDTLSGRAGRRLAALCGLPLDEFLARHERVNVLDEPQPKSGKGSCFPAQGSVLAASARVLPILPQRYTIMLGRASWAVEQALYRAGHHQVRGLHLRLFAWTTVQLPGGTAALACCPHPSGINRWWNDPLNVVQARSFWRATTFLYGAPGAAPCSTSRIP